MTNADGPNDADTSTGAGNDQERDVAKADKIKEGSEFTIPPTFAAGAALAVAALAAIGVSGDALTRATRNNPGDLAWSIIIVLAVVGLATCGMVLLGGLSRRSVAVVIAIAALAASLAHVVDVGAQALREREQPLISLSTTTEGDVVTVTVRARGSSLASAGDMLVQVQAIRAMSAISDPDTESIEVRKDLVTACGSDGLHREVDPVHSTALGPLLLWEQAGPDQNGSVEVESKIEVGQGDYEGLCARAVLRNTSKDDSTRATNAFVRLA